MAALAVLIEQLLARDAEARLQAVFRIIDAGMDHLAVARRRLLPEMAMTLEDEHLAARCRQRTGNGEADNPCADNDIFHIYAHALSPTSFLAGEKASNVRTRNLSPASLYA